MQVGAVRILAATHQIEGTHGGVDIEVTWREEAEKERHEQIHFSKKAEIA